jgi:hypothetical protein
MKNRKNFGFPDDSPIDCSKLIKFSKSIDRTTQKKNEELPLVWLRKLLSNSLGIRTAITFDLILDDKNTPHPCRIEHCQSRMRIVASAREK